MNEAHGCRWFIWAQVPNSIVPFNCLKVRLSPLVHVKHFGPLKQSFGLCHEGSHQPTKRNICELFSQRLPHRVSAAYFSTAGSLVCDTNTGHRVRSTAWPRSAQHGSPQLGRGQFDKNAYGVSDIARSRGPATQQALIRVSRALTRHTTCDERCDDSVCRLSKESRCCRRGRFQPGTEQHDCRSENALQVRQIGPSQA